MGEARSLPYDAAGSFHTAGPFEQMRPLLFWLMEVVANITSPSGRRLSVTNDAQSLAAITDFPEPGGPLIITTFFGGVSSFGSKIAFSIVAQHRLNALRWLSKSSKTFVFGLNI